MALHSSSSLRATTTSRSTVIRGRFKVSCTNIKSTTHQATTDPSASLSRCGDGSSYPGAVASRRHVLQASLTVAAVAFTESGWLWQPPPASAVEGLLAEDVQSVEDLPKGGWKGWMTLTHSHSIYVQGVAMHHVHYDKHHTEA